MRNWKTTLAGVGAILTAMGGAAVAIANGTDVMTALGGAFVGVTTGLGLIFAKDAEKKPLG